MSGNFRQAWSYLVPELWEPLAAYSVKDGIAPLDLFSDLFDAADESLSPRPTAQDMVETRNDPVKARERFLALQGIDFVSESAIVHFLESAFDIIVDYDIAGFEDYYRYLVRETIRKFNLRYRLDEPFILRFLLPGSFTNLYAELHRVNATNAQLAGFLSDFEKAFDRYARTLDPADLTTCIGRASIYAEGVAAITCGRVGATLGESCKQIKDWPHGALQAALSNLYGFCSDYPGIRHPGNPAGVRRSLASRDATLASLLLLSFSGYLSPIVDEEAVLGI